MQRVQSVTLRLFFTSLDTAIAAKYRVCRQVIAKRIVCLVPSTKHQHDYKRENLTCYTSSYFNFHFAQEPPLKV